MVSLCILLVMKVKVFHCLILLDAFLLNVLYGHAPSILIMIDYVLSVETNSCSISILLSVGLGVV